MKLPLQPQLNKYSRLLSSVVLGLFLTLAAISLVYADGPGALDTTFNGTGIVTTSIGSNADWAFGVAIQSDNKIVVAGASANNYTGDLMVVRYNSDGSLDKSFDDTGIVTTPVGSYSSLGFSVAIQPDDKIVVAGISDGYDRDFAVVRYTVTGSLDSTFNTTGIVTTDLDNLDDRAYAVAIQPDGKIVVVGERIVYNDIFPPQRDDYDFAVVRYHSDGSLDPTFNNTGIVTTSVGNYSGASSVAIQPDGKIVVAGWSDKHIAVVRYTLTGTLDAVFNNSGTVTTPIGVSSSGNWVALQPDGKIVVAGGSGGIDDGAFTLVRYTITGTLDTTFNNTGIVTTGISPYPDYATSVAVQPDGRIVVGGDSGNRYDEFGPVAADFAVVRYNSNGSLDTTFNNTGIVTTSLSNGADIAGAMALQNSDGKIVVAGTIDYGSDNPDIAVVRYLGSAGPNLALTKTVQLSTTPLQPGDPLTYTIVVANNDSGNATGVVISDTLPDYIDGPDLHQTIDITAGASVTYTLNVTLATDAPFGEVITNTASISHSSGRNEASVAITVGEVDPGPGSTTTYLPIIIKSHSQ